MVVLQDAAALKVAAESGRWRMQVHQEPQRAVQGRLPVDHQSLFDDSGEVKVLSLPLIFLAIFKRALGLL